MKSCAAVRYIVCLAALAHAERIAELRSSASAVAARLSLDDYGDEEHPPHHHEKVETEADVAGEHLDEIGEATGAKHVEESMEHAMKELQEGNETEGEEAEEEGEEAEAAGHVFALTMIGSTVLMTLVYAMAKTEAQGGKVSMYMWMTIDYVVAIFLAVLWYQAIGDILNLFPHPHSHALIGVVHAVLWLTVWMAISWMLRAESYRVYLAIFCGIGAHFVSFAAMHGVAHVQFAFFSSSYGACAAGCLLVLVLLAGLLAISNMAREKLGMNKAEEWAEQWNDVENDFAAMGVAICWTLFVRYMICGIYHAYPLEFDKDHASHEYPDPTRHQKNALLTYALVLIPVGIVCLALVSKIRDSGFVNAERVGMFVSALLSMCTAWAFLMWGQWTFYERNHGEEHVSALGTTPIFSRVSFALIASVIALITIAGLASMPSASSTTSRIATVEMVRADIEKERRVVILAVSMLVGWTWEQALDEGVECLAEGTEKPVFWKCFMAVCLAVLIVPVYAFYLKPSAMDSCAGSCECGASYTCDTLYCRKCGKKRVLRDKEKETDA